MDWPVGYVFRIEDALRYEEWCQSEIGRRASLIEQELLLRLWAPPGPQRVLEVGCGTGIFLDCFLRNGHAVSGIDPSVPMLEVARRKFGERVTLSQGYAENLPYEDNEFDTVALLTTLEYTDNPVRALEEALRVARRHVLLGVMNKYSLMTLHRYAERFWKKSYYRHAKFYGVFHLRHLIDKALSGPVPVRWRTCLSFPLCALRRLSAFERSPLLQWHPFGHFIGMRVDILYPLQTVQTPLFGEIPSRMTRPGLRASCWRSPLGNGRPRGLPPHKAILESPGPKEVGASAGSAP